MDRKFLLVLLVIFAGFIGFVTFNKSSDADESGGSSSTSKGSSNYYGKLDSPVTLTEFVDFQCEACYAYYPYVKQLKEKYKDQIRFQVRYFPIMSGHQFALQGARNAEAAARQGKFWEMHDKIFEGQKVWEKSQDPQEYFNTYAKEIGLDMAKFEADFKSNDVNNVVQKDLKDVQKLGGTGTPTFVLNGKLIKNPDATLEAMSKVVDDALKKAGITPNTGTAQPAANQTMTPTTGTGLNPGETQADHDRESQQGQ